ncbi:hypothetical protein M501DRAFT_402071 [Patellaria atrata CBS 101060]|uniref:RING-type domain-containing protein n=1 Tax=Patellaria atrata CBS 101060 TaxID=1346257 RepID=A0A9P4VU88_9PEZI|nr:hypothetical protein M501DRAFT_402071 [Patellaria atrata CBS 101060]
MASCDAPNPHYSCIVCVNKYIETEIGMNQCRTNCIDSSGCMGVFSSVQLRACLHERNFEKLEKLQQENDIRLAGLEGLEECPFCDFKAICPPAEIDREFRCQDSCCQKISCRLCQAESHVPQTCEEFARGHKKFDVRRQIEEAMSTALIRHCNKCGTAFLKEGGCNKMMCTMCKAYQCYVCSKSVKGQNYDHFHRGPCPLYDNYVRRDDETVKNAEAKASAKVRAENPYLTADDLKIGVSDAVQEEERVRLESADEAERIRLAGEQRNLFLEAPGPIHRPMWTRPAEGDYGVLHDNIQLIAEQVNNRAGALPPPDPRLEGIRWREHLQGPER